MTKPYSSFSKKDYVCAVGYGKTQEEADLNAKVELASLFGLAVDSTISRNVTEATRTTDGKTKDYYSEFFTMDAKTSVKVDNLYGVTIEKRTGKDGSFHSLAVMKKSVTLDYYRAHRESTMASLNSLQTSVMEHMGTIAAVQDAAGNG
ncbi:MAG: LPP20 family lipoprotein [Spirochaetales bacterium]|nr:LPP20 family lipoprotein [Candidatus Physcosoma equi]